MLYSVSFIILRFDDTYLICRQRPVRTTDCRRLPLAPAVEPRAKSLPDRTLRYKRRPEAGLSVIGLC